MDIERLRLLIEAAAATGEGAYSLVVWYYVFRVVQGAILAGGLLAAAWMVCRVIVSVGPGDRHYHALQRVCREVSEPLIGPMCEREEAALFEAIRELKGRAEVSDDAH